MKTSSQRFWQGVRTFFWILILSMGLFSTLMTTPVFAADHLEAPFVRQDGRTDINDVYIFHPGDPQRLDRTVIALTVNPDAGVLSPDRFSENAVYDLLVDQDGDAVEDLIFRSTFFGLRDTGNQGVAVQLIQDDGSTELLATGNTGVRLRGNRDTLIFAGLRDDPFVFDNDGFNAGATFCFGGGTGENFFAGFNLSAIVIEVPTSLLGSGQIGFWGVTRTPI